MWPGFVDALTALLLVMMFVLTIFTVVQFVLRETISGQETELAELSAEVNALALALGLEQQAVAALEDERGRLTATLDEARETAEQQSALIAALQGQVADQETALAERDSRITSFEAQVASLLAERDDARAEIGALEGERDRLVTEQEALQLAIAQARDEIDAQTEAARLAAARRQALDALIADLRNRVSDRETSLASALASLEAAEAQAASSEEARLAELAAAEELRRRLVDAEATLTAEEQARLAEAAAAEALRERLRNADAELTAMTLALEEQRRRAEETLTLLAAARAAEENLTERLAAALAAQELGAAALEDVRAELATLREVAGSEEALRDQLAAALAARAVAEAEATRTMSEAEERAALLAMANEELADERALSAESQRRVQVLNEQVAELRSQLSSLQALLDEAASRDAAAQVRIESLGSQLNVALARAVTEERRRAELGRAHPARGGGAAACRGSAQSRKLPVGVLRRAARNPWRCRGRADRGRPVPLLLRGPLPVRLARTPPGGARADRAGRPDPHAGLRRDTRGHRLDPARRRPYRQHPGLGRGLRRQLGIVAGPRPVGRTLHGQRTGLPARTPRRDRLRRIPPREPGELVGSARREPPDRAQADRALSGARPSGFFWRRILSPKAKLFLAENRKRPP